MTHHRSPFSAPFLAALILSPYGPAAALAQTQAQIPAPPVVPPAAESPAPPAAAPSPGKPAPPAVAPSPGKPAAASKPARSSKAKKPPAPARPSKPPPSRPAAYELLLTFDDGPRLDTTPKVLDALDQYGIKSVFFVNGVRFMGKGPQHDKQVALMRETLKRGHLVGNHTVHHFFLCGVRGPTIAEKEILENAQLIREAVGVEPPLFRTPFGSHCPSLSATLRRLGITPIGWDIDPQDWKLQNAEAILAVMKKELTSLRRARSIILFHDVQPATIEMLPRFLQWVTEESAARKARGEPPFKFIDYGFLLGRPSQSPPPAAPAASPPAAAPAPTAPPPAATPAGPGSAAPPAAGPVVPAATPAAVRP